MTDEPKKTENETANNTVDLKMKNEQTLTIIDFRLVFEKGTPIDKIIEDTKKVVDTFSTKRINDTEGHT